MKRYLIAASGMSPQVITETLYALHMEGRMVDGIRILTTNGRAPTKYGIVLDRSRIRLIW